MEQAHENELQYKATWPTTIGAVCIIVGGLSLFGGCLALTGMAEMEQLHTAIPFGDGELSKELVAQLKATDPAAWIESTASYVNILLSIVLMGSGMSLLSNAPFPYVIVDEAAQCIEPVNHHRYLIPDNT